MRPTALFLVAALAVLPAIAQEDKTPNLGVALHAGHSALRGRGVLVTGIVPESAAARAGLRAGDIILRFGDVATTDSASLIAAIKTRAIGDKVPLAILRDGGETSIEVELGPKAAESASPSRATIPDPLDTEVIEKQFRLAEKAYLTRDYKKLAAEAETLSAQVSFHLSTGLAGLDEGAVETARSEALHQRMRIEWYRALAEAGISVPINVYSGTIAGGSTVEERIARLVAQLGDEDFQKREDATKALRAIGEKARPQLEEAAKSDDMEVQWRARMLLEQLSGATLPTLRPPADYRPVAVSVTAVEGDRIEFAVETGDTLQSAGPLHVSLVREEKEVATLWVKDVELGSCRLHSQGEEDPAIEPGDRLLWIFKIEAAR